jgi:hypothetical protein
MFCIKERLYMLLQSSCFVSVVHRLLRPTADETSRFCFLLGHDFSRAANDEKMMGFSPCHSWINPVTSLRSGRMTL